MSTYSNLININDKCRTSILVVAAIAVILFSCNVFSAIEKHSSEPAINNTTKKSDKKAISVTVNLKSLKLPAPKLIEPKTNELWWLDAAIAFFGIMATLWAVLYTLGRQHRNTLRIQRENNSDQLKLKIYQEFTELLNNAENASTNVTSYAHSIDLNLTYYYAQVISRERETRPIDDRTMKLHELHYLSSEETIKIYSLLESYEIISPLFDLFQLAITTVKFDLENAYQKLHSNLIPVLPIDALDDSGNLTTLKECTLDKEKFESLTVLFDQYLSINYDMSGYLIDLRTELQNTLLSGLFKPLEKRRKPLDPQSKVITSNPEDVQRLYKYFNEESAWGVDKKIRKEKLSKEFDA